MLAAVVDLFSQDGDIWISGSGIDAKIPLAPALILFGPNDAGKTNTLLGITSLLRGEYPSARDPMADPSRGELGIRLVLDLERQDHCELLLHAARGRRQHGHPAVRPTFRHVPDETRQIVARDRSPEDDADDSPNALVRSLRDALQECVRELTESGVDSEDVVSALMRSVRLDLGSETTWLRFGDPSTLDIQDLDLIPLQQAAKELQGMELPRGGLAEVVDVVSSDQFEQSMDDLVRVANEILEVAGWEKPSTGDHWGFRADEWFHTDEHGGDFRIGGDPWFDSDTGRPSGGVINACASLSARATDIAPSFVTRDYRIEIQALAPRWWYLNDGNRLRIALVPHNVESANPEELDGFRLDAVGSGLRVWSMFAVYEALRRSSKDSDRATIFVFDEPERHLHPAAQREAAQFIASIVGEGATVIVATHAPAFLNEEIPHARYVRLSRVARQTKAFPLDGGRMNAIERSFGELGLTRADLIQLTRGVLLVEGEHDRLVVQSFFGNDLADAHVRVLQIRGSDNVLALVDADLLRTLDIPVFVMLDHTSARFIEDLNSNRLTPGKTKEERALGGLAVALRSSDFPVTHVSLNVPDIVWTLPAEAVKKVAPRFPGWKQATADLRAHKGAVNPKTFLRERYGLAITTRSISQFIAVAQEHGLQPSAELKSAIAAVLR
jgi:hypothetical protein